MSKKDKAKPEPTEKPVEGIGSRLKRGREEKELSLSDVVKQLNLAVEIIEALENDDADALPGPVFVQGYLRSYAKIIDIDADPLIELYRTHSPQPDIGSLSQTSLKQEVHSGHGVMRIINWAIGLGLIALTALWWVNQGEEMLVIDTQVDERVIESPKLALPKIVEIEERVIAKEPEPKESAVESQRETIETPALVVVKPSSEIIEPVTGQVELVPMADENESSLSSDPEWKIVLTFNAPCWVNIKDADGKGRIVGNIEEGSVRTLEGPAPYSVVLGNAAEAELRIDGQLIDITRYSKGNVARFTLNPAEFVSQ
jgi:cytoskeleton protein RodZ